ncbi:MAG: hypothetical protein K8H84_11085 [Sulfuricella denitrificans]|nr:hypothetical protein [Sulfuricella denitrificans]
MAKVIFFEKPGCVNNTRQKQLLTKAGHQVEAHDLLHHAWTAENLRPFFGARPVAAWFNRAAPRVKNGEIRPEEMNETAALKAMLADPLLIRRPLIQAGERREAGFEPGTMEKWLGIAPDIETDLESCPIN